MPRPPSRLTNQIKGILLEEVVLLLLRSAGYRTVEDATGDPSLDTCAAGLQVRGRGGEHQIDAIADFVLVPPFGYPQRLLVEAKCYAERSVDLEIVRNALGVFRDVSEYWASPPGMLPQHRRRYHYQYAVFATCHFTEPAQRFAYAHDIHLLPLARSKFFRPAAAAIVKTAPSIANVVKRSPALSLREVRSLVRDTLRGATDGAVVWSPLSRALEELREACAQVAGGYLAMIGGVFPLFLIPESGLVAGHLVRDLLVRVQYDHEAWYIHEAHTGRRLFSFDLPAEILDLYARSGALDRRAAAQLKEDLFQELQFVAVVDDVPRLITLRLDLAWLETLRSRARRGDAS